LFISSGVYTPTNVISISYGIDESYYPDFYVKRQCNEFMKLVLQGTTVVMSSGDSGVEGSFGSPCLGESGLIFDPGWAATCPYVLAVGSTEWDRFDPLVAPVPGEKLKEVATYRFPSGGGFSNVFGVADYQRDAVSAYFDQVESSLPFDGYHHFVVNGNFSSVTGGVYHHGGRAYPDVSAVGDRQVVYQNGSWWLVGGTSLSSPVWGAVLTLVNEARLAVGKSTVGFIHPILVSILWSSLLIEEILTGTCSMPTLKHLTISLMVATLAATHLVSLLLQVGIPSLDLGMHSSISQNLSF
jgi:tripeptidyl-peptidase-1